MLTRNHWRAVTRASVTLLLLLLCVSHAQAGDKLRKLKEDAKRLQAGTLLIAPVLPDSFTLRKYPADDPRRAAYLADLRTSTANLQKAVQLHYTFSKVQVLPPCADYPALRAAVAAYDPQRTFLLQFGHMAQFATVPARRASNYDTQFLGVYALDGSTRIYLNAGKVQLFPKLAYAESIVRSLQRNLERYANAKQPRRRKEPALLIPSLREAVALLPKEKLFGGDSATFLNCQYQTVVTVKPVRAFRAFGGVAMPGGSFATTDTIADTAAVRRDLAILLPWGNTLEFEAVIEIPVATKMNIGRAAPQGPLAGGGYQLILPFQWPSTWITRIYRNGTGESWTVEEFRAAFPRYFPPK